MSIERSPKDLLLRSIHVNDDEDLEGYTIIESETTRDRSKCITSQAPVKEMLLENGWMDVRSEHEWKEVTEESEWIENGSEDDDTIDDKRNNTMSSAYLRKDGKIVRFVRGDPYMSDYVIVNDGVLTVVKIYNFCQFMDKVKDATISTDIKIFKSLAQEPGIAVVVLLEDMDKYHEKTEDRTLLARIKVAVIKQNIVLLESHTPYDTALLICAFSNVVDSIER